jgi:hypothetical protein
LGAEQRIIFDTSGLDAASTYLKDRTPSNLRAIAESRGGNFAYKHYRWSNTDARTSAEEFWATRLAKANESTLRNAAEVRDYLLAQDRGRWLPSVLDYLPEGHRFDTTVHLNLGYDNVALEGDVAMNLGHAPFHADRREAVYYLMHELAHAGYLAYHDMPDLAAPATWGELAANVRFLTHLEGMGVITPLQLRTEEGGLGDPDYIALRDPAERARRVHAYFSKLEYLESSPHREVTNGDLGIYGDFSEKPMRLWYVAGCHMAHSIEEVHGRDSLRELVIMGCDAFFDAYHK